jgi:hypothetical protein
MTAETPRHDPMKKGIKARWIAALRNSRYRQGTQALRSGNSYCCLGVLCDLHAKAAFVSWEYDQDTGVYSYLGETVLLPRIVCEWAGLESENPLARKIFLTTHNDDKRRSHKQIARLIDTHL